MSVYSKSIDLSLAPFNAFVRLTCAFPWTAVIVASVLGVIAWLAHYGSTSATLAMYVGILVVWLDEKMHPRLLPEQGGSVAD